jgi:hypothetical protein
VLSIGALMTCPATAVRLVFSLGIWLVAHQPLWGLQEPITPGDGEQRSHHRGTVGIGSMVGIVLGRFAENGVSIRARDRCQPDAYAPYLIFNGTIGLAHAVELETRGPRTTVNTGSTASLNSATCAATGRLTSTGRRVPRTSSAAT